MTARPLRKSMVPSCWRWHHEGRFPCRRRGRTATNLPPPPPRSPPHPAWQARPDPRCVICVRAPVHDPRRPQSSCVRRRGRGQRSGVPQVSSPGSPRLGVLNGCAMCIQDNALASGVCIRFYTVAPIVKAHFGVGTPRWRRIHGFSVLARNLLSFRPSY